MEVERVDAFRGSGGVGIDGWVQLMELSRMADCGVVGMTDLVGRNLILMNLI